MLTLSRTPISESNGVLAVLLQEVLDVLQVGAPPCDPLTPGLRRSSGGVGTQEDQQHHAHRAQDGTDLRNAKQHQHGGKNEGLKVL